MDESTLSRIGHANARWDGSGWNIAKVIGVDIKSQSRTWARLSYEEAIPPGNKRKAK
jgi:hypothetical protein